MLMVANKRASLGRSAVHPVLRHSFVRSFFPLRSARWTIGSLSRSFTYLFANPYLPFARSSACAFVCVSGLFSCFSVCPVLCEVHGPKRVLNK